MYWVKMPNGTMPERRRKHFLDIPAYGRGDPGELWVIRAPDGAVSIVSSNLQPDHPNWPGAIKGWPVPSVAYQRKMHDLFIEQAQGRVDLYNQSLAELGSDPKRHTEQAWEFSLNWDPTEVESYSGPADPEYAGMLKTHYTNRLQRAQRELEELKDERP